MPLSRGRGFCVEWSGADLQRFAAAVHCRRFSLNGVFQGARGIAPGIDTFLVLSPERAAPFLPSGAEYPGEIVGPPLQGSEKVGICTFSRGVAPSFARAAPMGLKCRGHVHNSLENRCNAQEASPAQDPSAHRRVGEIETQSPPPGVASRRHTVRKGRVPDRTAITTRAPGPDHPGDAGRPRACRRHGAAPRMKTR